MKARIETKLDETFCPVYREVIDESHLHVGHKGYHPGGESHFSITLISAVFCGMNRIQRHQKVYDCLEAELKNGVHALRLKTLSPQEAEASSELA